MTCTGTSRLVGLHWIVVGGFLHACAGTNDEHAADLYADFEFDGLWAVARGENLEVPYYY
jgi:hypothetical protein